jgi:hypothetical protein
MLLIGEEEIDFYKQKMDEPNWGIDTDLLKEI